MATETKPCPICGEIINLTAKKCIQCGEFLEIPKHPKGVWPAWTGFNGRTLWEWLTILVIPIALTIAGMWFSRIEADRERSIEATADAAQIATRAAEAEATAVIAAERATATSQSRQATLQAQQTTQAERNILATQEMLSQQVVQNTQAEATLAAVAAQEAIDSSFFNKDNVKREATAQAESAAEAIQATEAAEATRVVQAATAVKLTAEAEAIAVSIGQATAEAEQAQATVQAAQQAANTLVISQPTAISVDPPATITPTNVPQVCTYDGPLSDLWMQHQARLGCPMTAGEGEFSWQPFAHGAIFKLNEGQPYLIALGESTGSWESTPESLPEPVCVELIDLAEEIKPIWCPPFDAGQALGLPQAPLQEASFVQFFEGGTLWHLEQAEAEAITYLFFDDTHEFVRQ